LFKMNTDGSDFGLLKSFSATSDNGSGVYTNADGTSPQTPLLVGDLLYAAARGGGLGGGGTIFSIKTNGDGFSVLKQFQVATVNESGYYTNVEGADPDSVLTLSGPTLYGVTYQGGSNGVGTVFAIGTNGTGFKVLKAFATNEGAYPTAGLVVSGTTLYGT